MTQETKPEMERVDSGRPQSGSESSSLWDAIPVAAKIAGVFVLVAGTFFATRASMQEQISEIQTRLNVTFPVSEYRSRSGIYESTTNLKMIEREIERVSAYFSTFNKPVFLFAKGNSLEYRAAADSRRVPPFVSNPDAKYSIGVKEGTTTPRTFRIEALGALVMADTTRSISDKNLVADLYALLLALSDWNTCVFEYSLEPDKMNPMYGTRVSFGLSESQVILFEKQSMPIVERVKASLPGLKDRVAEAYLRIDQVLQ